jgi:hypothetical protein
MVSCHRVPQGLAPSSVPIVSTAEQLSYRKTEPMQPMGTFFGWGFLVDFAVAVSVSMFALWVLHRKKVSK